MNDTQDVAYYRDGKLGWYETNPGNASEPRAWPPFDKWDEVQVGFFVFEGPGSEDTPDGQWPQLVITYGGPVGLGDDAVITDLRCSDPLNRHHLLRFVADKIRDEPEITPEGWAAYFDFGMPEWVEALY